MNPSMSHCLVNKIQPMNFISSKHSSFEIIYTFIFLLKIFSSSSELFFVCVFWIFKRVWRPDYFSKFFVIVVSLCFKKIRNSQGLKQQPRIQVNTILNIRFCMRKESECANLLLVVSSVSVYKYIDNKNGLPLPLFLGWNIFDCITQCELRTFYFYAKKKGEKKFVSEKPGEMQRINPI